MSSLIWKRLVGPLALMAGALPAASYRLSQGQDFSQAGLLQISPDGVWAVYVQDAVTDFARELWRVRVEGGAPARVSGTQPLFTGIDHFVISPDSQQVVYTAYEDDVEKLEIFSAPLVSPVGDGLKLNGPLAPGTKVDAMAIAPDSSRVVFTVGSADDLGTHELWSAKLDGSDLDRLFGLTESYHVGNWLITGDSQYVLLNGTVPGTGTSVLRVPLGGGGLFTLSSDLPSDRQPAALAASPDGQMAVYSANRDVVDRYELFGVPVAGGSPQQLSAELAFTHTITDMQFSPNGARVVYLVTRDGGWEVWSVEPDGDGNIKLNGALVAGGGVSSFKISPDSTRVVYLADQQSEGDYELYSVPIAGGGNFKLNGQLDDEGDVSYAYAIAADSAHVAFLGDVEQNGRVDLYAAPILGGPATRLSSVFPLTPSSVHSFVLSAHGDRAFYMQVVTPLGGGQTKRVWGVPISGGPRVRVDGCDEPDELVNEFGLTASPVRDYQALYVANEEPAGVVDVYSGDVCALCNGFEGTWRWSSPPLP
jgi:Tol biopolymer transport system component